MHPQIGLIAANLLGSTKISKQGILGRFSLLGGRVAGGAIWSLLDGALAQALGLVVFVANTHYLPPHAFGALATAIVLVEMIRQLVFLPVAKSVNSQRIVTDKDYTLALLINLIISLVATTFLFTFSFYLDQVFTGSRLSSLIYFMVGLTTINALSSVYEAILVRKLQFRSMAVRSIVSVIVGGGTGLYLAMNGYGIWSLVWQQIIQQGIALATMILLSKWRPQLLFDAKHVKRVIQFAAHISLNDLIGFIGYQADTVTIAHFLGPSSTGLFNSAKRISTALNQVILKPLERVALPALVRFGDDYEKLRVAYLRALGITALGTAPVFFGVALISNDIVNLLLGDKWHGVGPVLSALAISGFGSTITQYNSTIILVARQPKIQSVLNIMFVFVSLAMMLISVQYGILGVAIAVVIRSIMMLPMQTKLTIDIIKCSVGEVLASLRPALVASGAMMIGIWLLSERALSSSTITGTAIKVLAGFLIYVTVLLIFFREKVSKLIKGT
jgi:teichuronic acid exporter